jgi:hypothetical protein
LVSACDSFLRSSAITSAWRTRTSSSGGTLVLMAFTAAPEPAKESTCSVASLRARMMLSASNSSAHTRSVSPDFRLAKRDCESGSGRSTTRSRYG